MPGVIRLVYAYGPFDNIPASEIKSKGSTLFSIFQQPPSCLIPPEGSETLIKAANIWIGSNLTSRIHVDALDNVLCVAQGSKIVHLYDPWQMEYLDVRPPDRLPIESGIGSILFQQKDKNKSKRFVQAKRQIAYLNAGAALVIPAGWFHEVFTVSSHLPTIAISYWTDNADSKKINLRPSLMHIHSDGRLGEFLKRKRYCDDE